MPHKACMFPLLDPGGLAFFNTLHGSSLLVKVIGELPGLHLGPRMLSGMRRAGPVPTGLALLWLPPLPPLPGAFPLLRLPQPLKLSPYTFSPSLLAPRPPAALCVFILFFN